MDGGIKPSDQGDDGEGHHVPFYKTFERVCPFYLSIGMTYEQFWDGEAELPKYFRDAHDLRLREQNRMMYYQGAYVYAALTAVAPIVRAFSKAKEPFPYPDDVFPITLKERKEVEERREKARYEQQLATMKTLMERLNNSFEERKDANPARP